MLFFWLGTGVEPAGYLHVTDFGIPHAWFGTHDFIPSAISGDLNVKTTTGEADIAVRRTVIFGNLGVVTGIGADIVNFDDANVGGTTLAQTKGDTDVINIDHLTNNGVGALTNLTTFGGKVNINTGDGNDTIHLSDVAGTDIRFGATLTSNGGAGQDSYGNTAFNEFFATGNQAIGTDTVNGVALPV